MKFKLKNLIFKYHNMVNYDGFNNQTLLEQIFHHLTMFILAFLIEVTSKNFLSFSKTQKLQVSYWQL